MKSKYIISLPDKLGYKGMENYRIGEDGKPYRLAHITDKNYFVKSKVLVPAHPKFNMGENAYYFRLTKGKKTKSVRFSLEKIKQYFIEDKEPINLTV